MGSRGGTHAPADYVQKGEDASSTRIGDTNNGKATERVWKRAKPMGWEKERHPCACRLSAERRGGLIDPHWGHQQWEGNRKRTDRAEHVNGE
jgi:hypothetical protein